VWFCINSFSQCFDHKGFFKNLRAPGFSAFPGRWAFMPVMEKRVEVFYLVKAGLFRSRSLCAGSFTNTTKPKNSIIYI
jgi:hypothetical protein